MPTRTPSNRRAQPNNEDPEDPDITGPPRKKRKQRTQRSWNWKLQRLGRKAARSPMHEMQVVDPKPLVPGRKTIFDLPGELRNDIYRDALHAEQEKVPHYFKEGAQLPPDTFTNAAFALFLASSAIHHEARGLIANEVTAYIPVVPGFAWLDGGTAGTDVFADRAYNGPNDRLHNHKVMPVTAHVALAEFMNVHFHLHSRVQYEEDFCPHKVLQALKDACQVFMKYSQHVSKKHQWRRRYAIIHLDHFVSIWSHRKPFIINSYPELVNSLAADINTHWEFRYYVPTGTMNKPIEVAFRQADLAQFRALCRDRMNLSVKVEIYGDARWEEVEHDSHWDSFWTRNVTPCSSVWGNSGAQDLLHRPGRVTNEDLAQG